MSDTLFQPGHNCRTVAHADRLAMLVDGDAYFRTFAAAALRARQSICLVGWDFHSQTRLHLGQPGLPEMLGDFLNFLVRRRRSLHVYVLVWDYPLFFAKGRELSPIYGLGWRPRHRVHFRYDDRFPLAAAHHQKLVIIDGKLAFCGGLDLTRSRWDTPEHRPDDERRRNPGEDRIYPPFHDMMMALDGEAARALYQIVRERWQRATGKPLRAAESARHDPWPESLPVSLSDAQVAVARTVGALDDEPAIREVEALYLDMIVAARRYIYIENQYFTSSTLGEALAARLAEPDGPELIAVLRLSTEGWLEAPSMGTLRTVLLRKLRDADRFGHLHAYYPHVPGLPEGQCCDLHSKLMIVDDEWLRLGSANFCNRSMAIDTECDVAIEARSDERITTFIRDFRNGLLAEHLGVEPAEVEARAAEGSIAGAITALSSDGRTLRPYQVLDEPTEAMVAMAGVADPEQPASLEQLIAEFAPENGPSLASQRWAIPVVVAAAAVVLAALWRYTPLSAWADAGQVVGWARDLSEERWAPVLIVAAYTPAALVMFPRPLITLLAVVAFGAWQGFAYALVGLLLACVATYAIGLKLKRSAVRRIAGSRLNRLSDIMRKRGVLAVTAVRLVPLAPFAVVNAVAGAIRIRMTDFLLGSALGLSPGTLVATVLGDQLVAGLRDPSAVNVWLVAAVVLVLAVATWAVRRWLFQQRPGEHGEPGRAHGS